MKRMDPKQQPNPALQPTPTESRANRYRTVRKAKNCQE